MGTVCPSCITTVGAVSDLHPLLVPLARLVGTWRGTGHGVYAAITPFDYTDEWTFTDVGKPFLAFAERTWNRSVMRSWMGILTQSLAMPKHVRVLVPCSMPCAAVILKPLGESQRMKRSRSMH